MDTNNDTSAEPYSSLSILTTTMTSNLYHSSTPAVSHGSYNNNSEDFDNLTQRDIREYLDHLQSDEFVQYIPALCFSIIIAVFGFFGNSLVLFVYGFKFPKTPTRIFIMAIAMFDLTGSIIVIPGDVYRMFHLWDYSVPAWCRVMSYFKSWTIITPGGILLAVCITRYLKICRPFGKLQVNVRKAKIACVSITIIGWISTISRPIMAGIQTRQTDRSGIVGYKCSTVGNDYVGTIWTLINYSFFFCVFVAISVPLVVLYTLIGIQAYKHSEVHGRSAMNKNSTKTRQKPQALTMQAWQEPQTETTDDGNVSAMTRQECGVATRSKSYTSKTSNPKLCTEVQCRLEMDESIVAKGETREIADRAEANISLMTEDTQHDSKSLARVNKPPAIKSCQGRRVITRTTLMLFLVTSVFILSYAPFILFFFKWVARSSTPRVSPTMYRLLSRTQHINFVANAILYCFLDKRFRRKTLNLFKTRYYYVKEFDQDNIIVLCTL